MSSSNRSRFIYFTASTLNGYLADASHSLAWLFAVPDEGPPPDPAKLLPELGANVMGSSTYEWVVREERILERPARWKELAYLGNRPTFVFSSRELPVPEGGDVRIVRGQVASVLPSIQEAAGDKGVWLLGGGELVGQFWEAGALDEVQVSFAPATVSSGAPLLPRRIGPEALELKRVARYGQFAHLTYAVRSSKPNDR